MTVQPKVELSNICKVCTECYVNTVATAHKTYCSKRPVYKPIIVETYSCNFKDCDGIQYEDIACACRTCRKCQRTDGTECIHE